jgi:hypothetical protein
MEMGDIKCIESRCFHNGVVPELFKQLKHPIMFRIMYKYAGTAIILTIVLATRGH